MPLMMLAACIFHLRGVRTAPFLPDTQGRARFFELRHSAPRRDCEMLRRVLFLGILGAATCLSSVPSGSRSLPVQRLRGGGEFRFVDVGVANDETLRNEPFSQSVSSSEESAGSYGSSGEWCSCRRCHSHGPRISTCAPTPVPGSLSRKCDWSSEGPCP